MKHRTLHAHYTIFLIAACALYTGAKAQDVYRCGSTYRATPCEGGSVVDVRSGNGAAVAPTLRASSAKASAQRARQDEALMRQQLGALKRAEAWDRKQQKQMLKTNQASAAGAPKPVVPQTVPHRP